MYSQENNNFTNGLVLSDVYCPSEVIVNILIFVNWKDLLGCRLVCQSWYKLVDRVGSEKLKVFHKELLKLSFTSDNVPLSNIPFYICYAIGQKAFGNNHLKNAFGSGEVDHVCQRSWRQVLRSRFIEICSNRDCPKFKHWLVTESGGDGWMVETIPVGSQPLPEYLEGRSCFVTSYQKACKSQLVTLLESGLSAKIMDCIQPHIKVSEWYARRFDCGIRYSLKASLLNGQKEVVKEAIHNIEERHGDDDWHQVSHIFKDYGVGVRFVLFEHEGCDTQFWSGHYGAKMAGGSVVAQIPTELFEYTCDSI